MLVYQRVSSGSHHLSSASSAPAPGCRCCTGQRGGRHGLCHRHLLSHRPASEIAEVAAAVKLVQSTADPGRFWDPEMRWYRMIFYISSDFVVSIGFWDEHVKQKHRLLARSIAACSSRSSLLCYLNLGCRLTSADLPHPSISTDASRLILWPWRIVTAAAAG